MAELTLYGFRGSNAVLTARCTLAHKELAHRFVTLMPGLHVAVLRMLGFAGTTVPALNVDGRPVQGTRPISRALEELQPEPRLFPRDPARRAAVEEAEAWGEGFADAMRRVFYCIGRRDPSGFRGLLLPGQPPLAREVLDTIVPLVIRGASVKHRAPDTAGRADVRSLPERLDRIDAWIAAGVLNGPELNAADFQVGVNLAALLLCDDVADLARGRPAQALADRVAPGYAAPGERQLSPGTIPATLPADWLPVA